jgi:GTP-binding nuclear protein Ran
MSIEQITDALEVLSVNFANLTHLVQKFAENQLAEKKETAESSKCGSVPNFKVIVVGDTQVGKTSFVKRFLDGDYKDELPKTLGVEVHPVGFNTSYGPVGLNVWDCAGDEQFGGLREGYYKAASAAVVMYDVSNLESFEHTDIWIEKVRKACPDIPIVVVGNKVDATGFGALRSTTWNKDFRHYYVSAKSMYNASEPFKYLLATLMKRNDLEIMQ